MDDELLELFVQESEEHLDNLEPALLALEKDHSDEAVINEIFRAVHSIKGASGFFGLDRISQMAHIMENLMSQVREHVMEVDNAMVEALLKGTDRLRMMLDNCGESNEIDITTEVDVIKQILENHGDSSAAAAVDSEQESDKDPSDIEGFRPDPYVLMNGLRHGHNYYVVKLNLIRDVHAHQRKPFDFFKEIEDCGEFIDSRTDISGITGLDDAGAADPTFSFFFSTVMVPDLAKEIFDVPPEQVCQISDDTIKKYIDAYGARESEEGAAAEAESASTEVVDDAESEKVDVESLKDVTTPPFPKRTPEEKSEEPAKETKPQPKAKEPEKPAPAKSGPPAKGPARKVEETIRVSVTVLDDLMNLAGEMVLSRNQLVRLAEENKNQNPGLNKAVHSISYITSDLQEKVMQTRLQPVGMLFNKFTRIIRDLSSKLGKEISLEISGEEVELDKSIIEGLSDPLSHMIRNCCDHGVETPDERKANGKDPKGRVQLRASHAGDKVLIEIVDDGRGIDPAKIKAKAVEKGVISQEEADAIHDQQAAMLIFAPGFSTAEQISDVSGRGVGMDVVRTNIEGLGGSVELTSQPGNGTRFALTLPLTLAIVPSMIVASGGGRFAVPQVNLEEIVHLQGQHQIEFIHGSPVYRLRGRLIPIVSLAQVFATEPGDRFMNSQARQHIPENSYIVILNLEKSQFGLVVDGLHDSEEIVVKPLSAHIKSAQCYSGATIMGDGSVAMILDIQGIANLASVESRDFEAEAEAEEEDGEAIQQILAFRNHPDERFAISLPLVSRIERIHKSQLERIGDNEFIKHRDTSLRVIRLENYVNITKHIDQIDNYTLIIPKLVCKPIGILVSEVEDAIATRVKLDTGSVRTEGAIGSAIIDNELTLFVDIYDILERADPEAYAFSKASPDLASNKILLAEDTHFFQAVVGNYLREFSKDVTVVPNGRDAFELLEKEDFDLLVTDIKMPVMNGFELTSKIRSTGRLKDIPIIALTALSGKTHSDFGYESGVDAYETKLDKEGLRETIERIMKERQVNPAHAALLTS
ncbi:MAG: hybrid sensor histidine kinase/response regulator [Opitutales bacterium]